MPSLSRNVLLPVSLSSMATVGALVALASPAAAETVEAPEYLDEGPYLLVCISDEEAFHERNNEVNYNQRLVNGRLFEECLDSGYRSLADALPDVEEPGTRILILPGHYPTEETIVVDGFERLQIEGLGDGPEDVHLSAQFQAEAVMEATDSTGLYLKGFTVSQARTDGLLLDGVDGATVEAVRAAQTGQTGLRVADSADVLLTGCSAAANDTAGIAIADSDVDVTGCDSSGNLVGLLKTGGGAVTAESNRLHDNTTGLVVTDTSGDHRLEAAANAIFDNNTDHYDDLRSGACEAPLENRNWSAGVLCPDETAPSGVGVLIAEANDNLVTGNHIWGQHTTAAMVWGEVGVDDATPHRNRFENNTLGVRDNGQRDRNRLDLWWDGQGEGNCFDEPTALHTTPAILPSCGSELGPNRLMAEPVKTAKIWQCGTGALTSDAVPAGCDWFGAKFTDRLEFQVAVLFAAALLFLTGAGWLGAARSPNPPPPMSMTFSAIATGAAAVLMVLAAWSSRSDYEALAIGLWGLGWLLAGRAWFTAGLHIFGAFTSLIGGLAVLDAIDRGVWIIPVTPFSPAWMWLILLPLWLLLALFSLFRRYPYESAAPEPQRTPATIPVYNRFDW